MSWDNPVSPIDPKNIIGFFVAFFLGQPGLLGDSVKGQKCPKPAIVTCVPPNSTFEVKMNLILRNNQKPKCELEFLNYDDGKIIKKLCSLRFSQHKSCTSNFIGPNQKQCICKDVQRKAVQFKAVLLCYIKRPLYEKASCCLQYVSSIYFTKTKYVG